MCGALLIAGFRNTTSADLRVAARERVEGLGSLVRGMEVEGISSGSVSGCGDIIFFEQACAIMGDKLCMMRLTRGMIHEHRPHRVEGKSWVPVYVLVFST